MEKVRHGYRFGQLDAVRRRRPRCGRRHDSWWRPPVATTTLTIWGVGSRLQWDVTKSFYVGVEAIYQQFDSAQTGLAGNALTPALTLVNSGATTWGNQSNWVFTLRMQKQVYTSLSLSLSPFFFFVGYVHSAYCFGQESFCATNPSIVHGDVPSGYLVTLILKGLQFASIEQHVGEDGRERECNKPYLLLEPHVCSVTEDGNNEKKCCRG